MGIASFQGNLIIKYNAVVFNIKMNDIVYIEKIKTSKLIRIITVSKIIKCTSSLKDVIELLNDNFFRISKSHIVNTKFIFSIEPHIGTSIVKLTNEYQIQLPKKSVDKILNYWNE